MSTTLISLRAWLGNVLWQAAAAPEAYRFQAGLLDLRATQERILRHLLSRQARSPFGRRHRLHGLSSYRAFADLVPVSTYEMLLPYLHQSGGLSPDSVKVWQPTGGSTGGSKWIPWTAQLQGEFRSAVAVWIWHLLQRYPGVRGGRSYWQLTPKTALTSPDWLHSQNAGFESDGDYLGPLGRWLEHSVLLSTAGGADLWERTVHRLRLASDLRLISCWSPTFLLSLQRSFVTYLGSWEPALWWPKLQVISCWTQAASAAYRSRIEALFPGVAIQPKGLLSTEAVTTFPVGDRYPLAYRSHFFEFRTGGGGIVPSWKLERGQEVGVIVTTGSGFTRYDTGDQVRVTGRMGEVPCLEFMGRRGVGDFVGEKLSLALLEAVVARFPGFAMMGFEDGGYTLFLDGVLSLQQARQETAAADLRLMECYTYKDAIALGQLRPLRCFMVEGDAVGQYNQVCVEHFRQREGSVKPVAFHPGTQWSRLLQGEFVV